MKFSYQINIEPKELSVLNAVVESYIDLCKPISSNYLTNSSSLVLSLS